MEYEVDGEVNTSDFSLESNFENQVTWWDDIKWSSEFSDKTINFTFFIEDESGKRSEPFTFSLETV